MSEQEKDQEDINALRAFVGDEMARSDYKSVAEMRAAIEKLKAENADLESVKTKTDAMLQMALGDREALRSKLRAEAERVTARDVNAVWLMEQISFTEYHREQVEKAIRTAQAKEREGK